MRRGRAEGYAHFPSARLFGCSWERLTEAHSYISFTDTLSGTSKTLATLVPSYIAECRSLLNASNRKSQASTEKTVSSQQQPWKQSREAYLAWVHARALEASSSQQQGHEDGIETLSRRLGGQGSAPDVRVRG